MHKLQQHIIRELVLHPARRYSEIKPAEVEGNFFMYHLGKLMDASLVEKCEGGYQLTPEGKRYADKLSLETLTPRVQPKIVTMIAVRNSAGQWLLYRHGRAPFNEQVSLPYGKLHIDETVAAAASRELLEKTAVKTQLHHAGEAYLIIRESGEILSHMLAHVFTGTAAASDELMSNVGTPFWGNPSDYASELMPGTREIIDLVEKNKPFFAEFELGLLPQA